MFRDPKLRFMVHKVLPCFYWVNIPWLLVFGAPLYVSTWVLLYITNDKNWHINDGSGFLDTLVNAYFITIGLIFLSYFCFIVGLLLIPFWLAFVPYKLFKETWEMEIWDYPKYTKWD